MKKLLKPLVHEFYRNRKIPLWVTLNFGVIDTTKRESKFDVFKPIINSISNFIITKGEKNWNKSIGKWQTDYTILKIVKVSKHDIFK